MLLELFISMDQFQEVALQRTNAKDLKRTKKAGECFNRNFANLKQYIHLNFVWIHPHLKA